MVFTEIKKAKDKKYYYRVISIRENNKIKKERIYLGVNLTKDDLLKKENEADKELNLLSTLLTEKEKKELEEIKKEYLSQSKTNLENRYESFCSLFTYNSNAIEGNTLTLQETAQLLFEKRVPSSKSLREINETNNHREAFDFILNTKQDISRKFILDLHKIVCKNTLNTELEKQIGTYRTIQVYIRGVEWIPVKPQEVQKDMRKLIYWYTKNKDTLHPLVLASYFHVGFETVHPFVDGNGRSGRLLMNFILHKNNYPMISIPNSRKNEYYQTLEHAQVKGDLKPFILFLISLLKENKIRY